MARNLTHNPSLLDPLGGWRRGVRGEQRPISTDRRSHKMCRRRVSPASAVWPSTQEVDMPPSDKALLRYQAISAYLALAPPRGKRRATLEQLAQRSWTTPDGRTVRFAPDTLKTWVRRYRLGGLEALEDAARAKPGVRVLDDEQVEALVRLKQDVPERSIDRVLEIAVATGLLPPGRASRSTVHRVLAAHGVSGRPKPSTTTTDLDRFEAAAPNDLWQSDMLAGPWLPDPQRPGKHRRAWLYAFLDDHSRLLLAGRFAFKGSLPALELVFREALRRHGRPRKVYYDNGAVYRSRHMKQAVAHLGIHGMVFTTPYRPEGHGKIEAFNRLCRSAFISEVKASSITTLDELNLAFRAWLDAYYNRRLHAETQQRPFDRWRDGAHRVVHVEEGTLRQAFLWSEVRRADKAGVLSLNGVRYQVGPELARKKVEIRFDPERLEEVEIWLDGIFRERVRPFAVQENRRPKPAHDDTKATASSAKPALVDWLGHLVTQRGDGHLSPDDALDKALEAHRAANTEVRSQVEAAVSPEVFEVEVVDGFLDRYGPFDPAHFGEALELAVALGGPDQHLETLLHGVRTSLGGGV